MRKSSSAAQLEFEYSDTVPGDRSDSFVSGATSKVNVESPVPLEFPDFGTHSEAYALTSRIAGRLNAASIPEQEYKDLLRERQQLLDKKLDKSITRKDSIRLEYIRWSLDRIEDAKFGQTLDFLENSVSKYEQFLSDVRDLDQRLQQYLKKKRK